MGKTLINPHKRVQIYSLFERSSRQILEEKEGGISMKGKSKVIKSPIPDGLEKGRRLLLGVLFLFFSLLIMANNRSTRRGALGFIDV